MTEQEASAIVNNSKQYFKDIGFNEEDIECAIAWITQIFLILMINQVPLDHKYFPEVLRGLANILELKFKG